MGRDNGRTNLLDAISWAVIELQTRQPNIESVVEILDVAMIEIAKLTAEHEVGRISLTRLARAMGD